MKTCSSPYSLQYLFFAGANYYTHDLKRHFKSAPQLLLERSMWRCVFSMSSALKVLAGDFWVSILPSLYKGGIWFSKLFIQPLRNNLCSQIFYFFFTKVILWIYSKAPCLCISSKGVRVVCSPAHLGHAQQCIFIWKHEIYKKKIFVNIIVACISTYLILMLLLLFRVFRS